MNPAARKPVHYFGNLQLAAVQPDLNPRCRSGVIRRLLDAQVAYAVQQAPGDVFQTAKQLQRRLAQFLGQVAEETPLLQQLQDQVGDLQ
jgi:hypothetical protein